MSEEMFEIKTEGIDVKEIMAQIEQRVETKRKSGVYDKYNLDNITELNIEDLKDEQDFLVYYLRAIKRSCEIDINDFEIPSRGGILGKLIVLMQKVLWKLLKFYTYRLFSQQREFNAQMVTVVQGLNQKIERNFEEMKKIVNKK